MPAAALSRRPVEPLGLALGAQRLLAFACQRGADRHRLLRAMGPGAQVIEDADARLPTRCYYNLIEEAARALGDPWFGIHYLQAAQPGDIAAVGFAAVTSATFGEALGRVSRYLGFLTQSEELEVSAVREGRAWIRWRLLGPAHPAHPLVSEMYAYNVTGLAARLLGSPVVPLSLRFAHQPLVDPGRYEALFGCRPDFGAAEPACVLDASVLERPMPRADAAMAAFFDHWLAREVGTSVPSLQAELERELLACLSEGVPTLDRLARRLCVSPRTLQRRLAGQGLSLRALVDGLRRRVALQQVAGGEALAEISYLLGFADTRSFFRAFRRWTGQSPSRWRSEGAGRP